MTGSRLRPAYFVGLLLAFLAVALQGVQSEEELEVPPEDLCRPYIEKALKDLGTGSLEQTSAEAGTDVDKESQEDEAKPASEEEGKPSNEDVAAEEDKQESVEETGGAESGEQDVQSTEAGEEPGESAEAGEAEEGESEQPDEKSGEVVKETEEDKEESVEQAEEGGADSTQEGTEEDKDVKSGEEEKSEEAAQVEKSEEEGPADAGKSEEEIQRDAEIDVDEGKSEEKSQADDGKSDEVQAEGESAEEAKTDEEKSDEEAKTEEVKSDEEKTEDETTDSKAEETEEAVSKEEAEKDQDSKTEEEGQSAEQQVSGEEAKEESKEGEGEGESTEGQTEEEAKQSAEAEEGKSEEETAKSVEDETVKSVEEETAKSMEEEEEEAEKSTEKGTEEEAKSAEEETDKPKSRARREIGGKEGEEEGEGEGEEGEGDGEGSKEPGESEEEPTPEEDLIREIVVPENLRPRDHINQLLKLDEENEEKERAIQKHADVILKELKRVYDNAIQPLESLYKYRDLSNRHFGDPEIFSKPLVLFMGPWSGGKSSIINYLLDIEYSQTSLRTGGLRECFEEQCKTPNGNDTGAEPSPAYFNIIMHGEEEEILDGTQLAADWTFSGLQKFGQGLLDRLKGLRLDNKLLEKVNIVEIPGILEIRKQVQRLFPFNDACQWFIDRADIIFLVYDPSKLDVGPETEAILDQLKGREHQTRIILNKADQVKPEELMRVQGALIWNISPLMSSAEPPIMYSTSLWSLPYEAGAPTRLLYAQERAFLRDLRTAIDKRVEHKIASARRFAVRVRNHAKMVDCYLTTYYNHKTFFGNKKEISDKITDNPQDYHIYEGLSTLKNISRYDLPDPDVYRDFFRLNPLYDFPLLSSTCTYFRGCPINRLDVAIAYDLPELVGKYKKSVEQVIHEYETSPSS
ncbi:eukaryotic translation initiation factor 5B isoform X1 [Bombus pascuorum]|uniref:eukaryotic translation initiation factor 5B isoform X1 n=1 Tax=Bombus pascuorum TaxID=65598 RepID=UPI00212A0D3A|nr:eukaryotic translation initiation factor 5B isoform X1 [Bombus pascuorum]